ncbi:FUSC family protein [Agrobacterium sp. CNPSo 2736]|uniref:FUSC family protein n=1 Tax=Agrobacterium sp. CNPSo 2736 TaxID=2499627 RepID=UPI000FD90BAB|nr:FUSC family protein [Agrobacterium sp. CNPSo 2736]RVT69957.1 FUSC family protein [Agrobacterium sp. CNPSo 2736]
MSVRTFVTPRNVIFSLKTFLAAMLAYYIAIRFDLPRPFWAVSTVYIVAHPLSGAISSKSFYRLLGTLIGGGATIIMVPNLVNSPLLLSAAIIFWVSGCTFISLLDRTPRSYVSLLAGYTVLLAGLPLVTAPASTFDAVVARVEEIGLAILCASIVSHVVFPVHVGTTLLGRIDAWMARAQALLAATATAKADQARNRAERYALAAEAADLRSFTVHLRYDGSRYRSAVSLVRSLQHRMVAILPLLSELEDQRRALARLDTPGTEQAMSIITAIGSTSLSSPEFLGIDAPASFEAPRSWEVLLLANVSRSLRNIAQVSHEYQSLRDALKEENAARAVGRFASRENIPAQHADIAMALLSALAVAICLTTSITFWIASAWTDGMTFAQISGVLCCLLATMDDPVPAMRKFVYVTIGSVIAASVYAFAILPLIDGFVPLVAALGLFLIPAGICLAVPSLAIVGMGLCINFPLLLTLQAHQSSDFIVFANSGTATVLGMVWAIVVCGIFRSVRAETNARRLFSVTQAHVAGIAAGQHADAHVTRHHVIDVAGMFAVRAAKLPATSDTSDADLMRDLRAGLHITAMQVRSDEASIPVCVRAEVIFSALELLYRITPAKRGETMERAIGMLDAFILSSADLCVTDADTELMVHAVALRLCLSPETDPPVSTTPPSNRNAR